MNRARTNDPTGRGTLSRSVPGGRAWYGAAVGLTLAAGLHLAYAFAPYAGVDPDARSFWFTVLGTVLGLPSSLGMVRVLDYTLAYGEGRPEMLDYFGMLLVIVANWAALFWLSGLLRRPRRRAAAAVALLASASACGEPCEAPAQASASAGPGLVPRDTAFCIPPEPHRAAAEAAAIRAVGGPLKLRVSSFTPHHDGSLVSVSPAAADVAGGGGLVWVDRDGCVTLIERSE